MGVGHLTVCSCYIRLQICLAQNSEATGQYQLAFSYYKTGVGILLQGVQGDTNKARRDAVRRKTAQYLMKAEDLYNRHLAMEKLDERRWAVRNSLDTPYVLKSGRSGNLFNQALLIYLLLIYLLSFQICYLFLSYFLSYLCICFCMIFFI